MPTFKKIKLHKDTVRLEWFATNASGGEDIHSLESDEKPIGDFARALKALTQPVIHICELPDDYAEGLTPISASFSYGGDGRQSATITALKHLTTATAPLVINTPHLADSAPSPGCPALPAEAVEALIVLCEQAEKYLDGEREQGSLPM